MAEALLTPTPAQRAAATTAAQRERDALQAFADQRLGHAARVLTGLCLRLDPETRTMHIQSDTGPQTLTAQYGALPVTAALVGQRVLCLEDPLTRQVYFRIGLSE